MNPSPNTVAFAPELLSSVEVSQGSISTPVELAGHFDITILNDNLVRLQVKAFGWEVNRNNFLFNKKALLTEREDALGRYIPAWQSFERQLVNANHLMKDNKNSRVDKIIGFIEKAELQDDGVYLTLIAWKRTLDEDQLTQIREGKVSVSMEVSYNNPLVIVDGEAYPPSTISYDPRTAVRTMADDSVLSFIGIAILFDNIKPGFASQEVLVTENAALVEDGALVSGDTHTEVSMEKTELEQQLAELQTKQSELASALETKDAELASAQEELNAKQQELEKLYEELDALRVARFNEAVATHFDLGKLSADTAAWLLDMIRWSGDVEATAAKLAEISGSVKSAAPKENASAQDCEDGTCGECAACKKKKETASEELPGVEDTAAGESTDTPLAENASAEGEGAGAEGNTETAALAPTPSTEIVNLAGKGGEGLQFNHKHL